jgi:class 3 adenylate cyclase
VIGPAIPKLTVPGTNRCDDGRLMAELGARERAKLPDSAFAYIDSAGRRRLPIHDEAHVRNALARFNRVLFEDDAARDWARTRLLKAAKRHGIVPVGFIDAQLRPKLPTGQLTLLFSDIQESSRHLDELDDRYGPVLSAVRRIHRTMVRRHGGHEVDARADEYFAVFPEAAAALEAAIDIQRGMAAHRWPDGREVRVRIGLHTGRPTLTPTGYQGISVNAAARICACAHGGQVIVSQATRSALREASATELRSLGIHRLRGISDDHELFQVVADGLPDQFPPLRIGT